MKTVHYELTCEKHIQTLFKWIVHITRKRNTLVYKLLFIALHNEESTLRPTETARKRKIFISH